jgi:hypothetical protein
MEKRVLRERFDRSGLNVEGNEDFFADLLDSSDEEDPFFDGDDDNDPEWAPDNANPGTSRQNINAEGGCQPNIADDEDFDYDIPGMDNDTDENTDDNDDGEDDMPLDVNDIEPIEGANIPQNTIPRDSYYLAKTGRMWMKEVNVKKQLKTICSMYAMHFAFSSGSAASRRSIGRDSPSSQLSGFIGMVTT